MTATRRVFPHAPLATWLGCLVSAALIVAGTVLVAFSSYCEDACDGGTDWGMVRLGVIAWLLALAVLIGAAWAAGARPVGHAVWSALRSLLAGLLVLPLAMSLGQGAGRLLSPGPDEGGETGVLTLVFLGCGLLWWIGLTARMARREPRLPLLPRGDGRAD